MAMRIPSLTPGIFGPRRALRRVVGNVPLAITSNGGGPTASIDYDEGLTSAITTVEATGGTEPYVFSITGGADEAFFAINSSTGALTPLAAFDYEDPEDAGANNSYVVEVTVTDDAMDTVSQTITVNVQAVEEPTVFTLTISDLENYVEGSNTQRFKLDVDTVNIGTVTTGFIDLFWVGSGPKPSDGVAAAMASALTAALSGALSGQQVTVDDISSGGDYIFTISIPETVGVVNAITLNEAGSQLFPVIELTESVIQQGVDGVQEQVSITADDPSMTTGDTTSDNNGNSVTVDASNLYTGSVAGAGWTAGAPSGNTVVFTKEAAGEVSTVKNGGNGTVTVITEGAGTVEIHLISRNVAPTGGNWQPSGAGTEVAFNADTSAIASAIGSNFSSGCTADQSLTVGAVLITATAFGNLSDTQLAPVNVSLTAPAISVAITP